MEDIEFYEPTSEDEELEAIRQDLVDAGIPILGVTPTEPWKHV